MKRKIFILILFIVNCKFCEAQGLSIILSVEYCYDSIGSKIIGQFLNKKDSASLIPYLVLKYSNETTEPIYFRSLARGELYPPLPSASITHSLNSKLIDFKNYTKHTSEKYKVDLSLFSLLGTMWKVNAKDEYKLIRHTIDPINYEISWIGTLFDIQRKLMELKTGKQLFYINDVNEDNLLTYQEAKILIEKIHKSVDLNKYEFNSDDFKDEKTDSAVINEFIFLKGHDTFVQKFDLSGFQVVGGTFRFSFDRDECPDYVLGDASFVKADQKWKNEKIYLPEYINGYKLYRGKFVTNLISISL